MLNRLIEPFSGRVQIGGEEITRMTKSELIRLRRKKMSMAFQSLLCLLLKKCNLDKRHVFEGCVFQ